MMNATETRCCAPDRIGAPVSHHDPGRIGSLVLKSRRPRAQTSRRQESRSSGPRVLRAGRPADPRNPVPGLSRSVQAKGWVALDARASILAGGTSGPAVVPGEPKESLLVNAINYGETYQMPPKSKLPDREIATLTRWVQMGAAVGDRGRIRRKREGRGRKPRFQESQVQRDGLAIGIPDEVAALVFSADPPGDASRRQWASRLGSERDRPVHPVCTRRTRAPARRRRQAVAH